MTNGNQNYIKDVSVDQVKQTLAKPDLMIDDPKLINDHVEAGFQQFLKTDVIQGIFKDQTKIKAEKMKDYMVAFNDWLDSAFAQIKNVDMLSFISQYSFELNDLQTDIELSKVMNSGTNTSPEVVDQVPNLTESDIAFATYAPLTKTEIVTYVNTLDASKKKEISDILKTGNVGEIQKTIASNDSDFYKNLTNKSLLRDSQFGTETFAALKKYADSLTTQQAADIINNSDRVPVGASSGTTGGTTNPETGNTTITTSQTSSEVVPTVEVLPDGLTFVEQQASFSLAKKEKKQIATLNKPFDATKYNLEVVPPFAGKITIDETKVYYTGVDEDMQETMKYKIVDKKSKQSIEHVFDAKVGAGVVAPVEDADGNLVLPEVLSEEDKVREKMKERIITTIIEPLISGDDFKNSNSGNDAEVYGCNNPEVTTVNIDGKDVSFKDFISLCKKGKVREYYITVLELETYTGSNDPIKKLVISDNPNYGKVYTHSIQVEYKGDMYLSGGEQAAAEKDKKAIRKMLSGKDEEFSLTMEGYTPKGKERKDLRELKHILNAIVSDEYQVNPRKVWEKIVTEYQNNSQVDREKVSFDNVGMLDKNGLFVRSDEKLLQELGGLYSKWKQGAGGDYFTNVMGLLENRYLRKDDRGNFEKEAATEAKGKKFDDYDNYDAFSNLYAKEHIGIYGNLADKNKKAYEMLFATDEKSQELARVVKKIDLEEFFFLAKYNKPFGDNEKLNKDEKLFVGWYNAYVNNLRAGIYDAPETKNPEAKIVTVLTKQPKFNKSFNLIVSAYSNGMTIIDAANANIISDKIVDKKPTEKPTKERTKEMIEQENKENAFVSLLSDLNFDARTDFGDRGLKTGLEIQKIYKDTKDVLGGNEAASKKILDNILAFAGELFLTTNEYNAKTIASELTFTDADTYAMRITKVFDVFEKYPGLLKGIQMMLVESPLKTKYILEHGKDAFVKYYDDVVTGLEINEGLQNQIDAEFDRQLATLRENNPSYAEALKNGKLLSVARASFVAGIVDIAGEIGYGAGVSKELISTAFGKLSLNLGAANIPQWGVVPGLTLSWNKSFALSDNLSLDVGISGGANYRNVETLTHFIPLGTLYVGPTLKLNPGELQDSFTPTAEKKLHLGGNVSVVGGFPPLSWGLGLNYSSDRLAGIEKQSKIIAETLGGESGLMRKIIDGVSFGRDRDMKYIVRDIMDVIKEIYPKSDVEDLRKAAENIYRGLLYFNVQNGLADDQKQHVADMMSEYYIQSWRNDALLGVGKLYFSGIGIGVQFLAGYYPIPSVIPQFTKYKNLYYTESSQSRESFDRMLYTGEGMKRHNDKETISQEDLTYINLLMKNAHPNQMVPSLEMVSYAPAGKTAIECIAVPVDLWKYANINIDPKLKSYVTFNKDKTKIYLPATIKFSFLDASKAKGGEFHLIFGDTKVDENDIKVDQSFIASAEKYKNNDVTTYTPEKASTYAYLKGADVQKAIEELSTKDTTFPIDVALGVQSNLLGLGLTLKDGASLTIMGKAPMTLQGKALTLPSSGSLTIYRTSSGNYEAYYSSSPAGELVINYQKEGVSLATTTDNQTHTENNQETIPTETIIEQVFSADKRLFNFAGTEMEKASSMIESNLEALKNLEYGNNMDDYVAFMKNMKKAETLPDIDNDEIAQALVHIQTMIATKSALAPFGTYLTALKDKNDYSTLAYVMDKLKVVFAIENYTGSIHTLMGNRKGLDISENQGWLTDIDKQFPIEKAYYLDLVKGAGDFDASKSVLHPNLIGYTAFYRVDTASRDHYGYSLTPLGETKVHKDIYKKVDDKQLPTSIDWMLKKFEESKYEQEYLVNSIVKSLPDEYEGKYASLLTFDNIQTLLKNPSKGLQIGDEIITLDFDVLMYVLGECANESLGIEMKGIKVGKIIDNTPDNSQNSDGSTTDNATNNVEVIDNGGMITAKVKQTTVVDKPGLYVNTGAESSGSAYYGKVSVNGIGFTYSNDKEADTGQGQGGNENNPANPGGPSGDGTTDTPSNGTQDLGGGPG